MAAICRLLMTKTKKMDDANAQAAGLARYAYEYIEAARLVDREIGAQKGYEFVSPTPAYFLAMHGIELTLKAFLCHHGLSDHELRGKTYGHDLRACYRKSKELGLLDIFKSSTDDVRAMAMLVRLNHHQGLRYIQTGWKRFPSWAIVGPLAVRLHQAVAPRVGYRTFNVHFG